MTLAWLVVTFAPRPAPTITLDRRMISPSSFSLQAFFLVYNVVEMMIETSTRDDGKKPMGLSFVEERDASH
jgi:hypothetical protein